MQEDGVTPGVIQLPPCLVGQLQRGDNPSMFEAEWLVVVEHLVASKLLPIHSLQLHWPRLLLQPGGEVTPWYTVCIK